ncbi:MAG: hypothetical protein GY854_30245 [Deltaproteobacteria bacterium]|nr:hypothetical protein [Deltaproteobacteria bacterium]
MDATKIIEELGDDYDFGWRYQETKPAIGDVLPCSNVWHGDDPTDEELPGTCAWDTRSQCEDYAKHSSGYMVLLGGVNVQSGDLAGEIILEDAEVFAVWDWRNEGDGR